MPLERGLAVLRGGYPHWRPELQTWTAAGLMLWGLVAAFLWNARSFRAR